VLLGVDVWRFRHRPRMGKQLALDQHMADMLACSHVGKKKKKKGGREGGVVGQIFVIGGEEGTVPRNLARYLLRCLECGGVGVEAGVARI
jgi:hypothetical protein